MTVSIETRSAIDEFLKTMTPILDEKWIMFGDVSKILDYGGTAAVHEMTGAARNTITSGKRQAETIHESSGNSAGIRKPGAGRKSTKKIIQVSMKRLKKL